MLRIEFENGVVAEFEPEEEVEVIVTKEVGEIDKGDTFLYQEEFLTVKSIEEIEDEEEDEDEEEEEDDLKDEPDEEVPEEVN